MSALPLSPCAGLGLAMAVSEEPVIILGEDESWELLSSAALGRLVICVGSRPEVFPVTKQFISKSRLAG